MMDELANTRVLIFGLGGVGSWCAEALARTGIGYITLVDFDNVAESNINRQMPALHSTVGLPKVDVVARRIGDINPACHAEAIIGRYSEAIAQNFNIEGYDYVIDAIDSLADKADLILRCTDPATAPSKAFFSSMGAARRIDMDAVSVNEFWKVEGCALARALRTRYRRADRYPKRKFTCVYSSEQPLPQTADAPANGTFAHITATFGLRLAALVIKHIYTRTHTTI